MLQIESDEMLHIERQSAINSIITLMEIYGINVEEIYAESASLLNYTLNESSSRFRKIDIYIAED
ncbi:hypothetical protein [Blastomonas sp.]|uniref:hypothetical protein n=1 Tax=Blastomonas sp. TaxID=1909299 RepID=UPI00406A5092